MVTRDIIQRLLNVINDTRQRVNTLESREYVLLNATQTLTNKTLTTPTIGDFTNAQHDHADAAGGGQLSLTTAVSGILPPANGGTGVNNATRTLTINTNSGTLAFSGASYTLTIPATGTAALLATAQTFTQTQTISHTSTGIAYQLVLSNTSTDAAARGGFQMVRGGDAGTGNSRGSVLFTTSTLFGFADYETRTMAIYTGESVGSNTPRLVVLGNGNVGIGNIAPSAQLHVDQTSATGAKPALRLQQADLSEEFIRFETNVNTGNPINTTALGTYYGRVRVHVQGIGEKWLALYNT